MKNDVERLLQMQQTGEYIPTEEEKKRLDQAVETNTSEPVSGSAFQELRLRPGEMRNDVLGMEAALAGYGQSRYDTGEFNPEEELENKRAIDQSGFWKIANGAIKGGIYAGTTAVETVAGVIDGLLEGTYELARQIGEKEQLDLGNVVGKGVDNFTARTMQNIQKLSDEWFPNYRTTEERSPEYQEEWLKHIFTANFIGDSFLKNFGFTVGALAGGAVWSKALNAAMRAGAAADLMKGVTAAAEGDAAAKAALQNTLGLVSSGAAQTVDAEVLAQNISAAAKALNKTDFKKALFGSVIAAMGEGTMEGVMAKNEYEDKALKDLNRDYAIASQGLRDKVTQDLGGSDMVRFIPVQEGENIRYIPQLNEKGEAYLEQQRKQLADEYYEKRAFIEDQAQKVAATTFILNLPILTASNTVQFGRMFSGGFKTARNTAKVAGRITNNAGTIAAEYAATGNKAARAALGSLKVGTSEAAEEMLQGIASSGAKQVADARLTAFNDDAYDPDVMDGLGSFWRYQMQKGGQEYLGDWKNWQEGFLGLVTGLIGMPGKQWQGGIAGSIREANEEVSGSAEAATALNNRINTDKFKDAWKGYVRHMKYDNEMEAALEKDDQYSWKTANDKQLINDIMLFANAGRLQDLKDLVDVYSNLSDEEASKMNIPEAMTNSSNEKEVKNDPAKIIAKVKDQAGEIKKAIDLYSDMYDAMSTYAPADATPAQLEEMIATAMNIKAFEQRFLDMFDNVIKDLDQYVTPLAKTDKYGEELKSETEQKQRAKELYDYFARAYTGTNLPVKTRMDALDAISSLVDLEESIKTGNPKIKELFEDMTQVALDRKKFLKKLFTLRDLPSQKFEEQAQSPDKIVEQQRKEEAEQETKGLDSMDAVRTAYLQKTAKEKADFIKNIETIEDTNPNVKEFLKIKRKFDGFLGYLEKNQPSFDNILVTPKMVNSAVNDLFRKASSEEDFSTMPDKLFPSLDEFVIDYTNVFGAPGAGTLESLKSGIRKSMADYLGIEIQTASRNKLTEKPMIPGLQTFNISTPTGYDAAQPGSKEPAPSKKNIPSEGTKQKPQEPEPEIIKGTTPGELVDDSISSFVDELPRAEDEKMKASNSNKTQFAFYHTGFPEIDSFKAKKARRAIMQNDKETLRQISLNDIWDENPDFAETGLALKQSGAFDAIAMDLKPGDEIEFVVDPTFPPYDGKPQILMTTVKDGNRQVLSTLSYQTSKYYNLNSLRKTIDQAYSSWAETHPNELFVFDKKSVVWTKRPGLIDYDYTGKGEKGIRDIPCYTENAPIVFIDRNGHAVVVNKSDNTAADKVSLKFNSPDYNRGDVDGIDRRGNLYYLVETNNTDSSVYTPIRLNVEHFRQENKDADIPLFNQIRKDADRITTIVRESNQDNYTEKNEELRQVLSDLTDKLDLSNIYFEIGNYNNIGVALKVVSNYTQGGKTEDEQSTYHRPNQLSDSWVVNYLAGLDRSIQIKLEDGKLKNQDQLISQGILTSNAKMLRPKGVDFYINPWTDQGKFAPITDLEAQETDKYVSRQPAQEFIPEPNSVIGDSDSFGSNEFFGLDTADTFTKTKRQTEDADNVLIPEDDEFQYSKWVQMSIDELPVDIKTAILEKGYTETEYNNMPELLKEKVLRCL